MKQTNADDKRYPRQGLANAIRWIFLHWWLLPLVCLLLAIIFYLVDVLLYSQPFAFFIRYWWLIILCLIVGAGLLFLAYRRAEAHEIRKYRVLQQRRQRELEEYEQRQRQELELQLPPPGFTLQHTLSGHAGTVFGVAWSPDGRLLTSASRDTTIRLWDAQTAQLLLTLSGHTGTVFGVAWSPDGRLLASASFDTTIRLWDAQTAQPLHTLSGHADTVWSVAWSPDGRLLASASDDTTIRLWDAQTAELLHTLSGHTDRVNSVVWSPDGRLLTSASDDTTIRLWEAATRREVRRLERHTGRVFCVSFSADGRLLTSKSTDGTVRLWDTHSWEEVTVLNESSSNYLVKGLAFHPQLPILATLGKQDTVIRLWQLDVETLLRHAPDRATAHYTNAKVVLVGDSGVGKSALGLVLTIDARSETDPFAGVYHWEQALRIAQEKQGSGATLLKKLLVAARCDRGGIGVSTTRLEALKRELGFDGYFETSAKEGSGIEQLREAIAEAIDWDMLPKVSSTTPLRSPPSFMRGRNERSLFGARVGRCSSHTCTS